MRARREIEIINLLNKLGAVQIKELTSALGVSRNTVRRDLQSLEQQGVLRLTRGGAILNPDWGSPQHTRTGEPKVALWEEKHRIGRCASELIPEEASIILDAGTTTAEIAAAIRNRSGLTIITNAISIADQFAQSPQIATVLAGGLLNTTTGTFTGDYTEELLKQFHVDIAFISAGGVTSRAITNTNTVAGKIKRIMIDIAEKSYLVVTHDKVGKRSLVAFAGVQDVTGVITDDQADAKVLDALRDAGLQVVVC